MRNSGTKLCVAGQVPIATMERGNMPAGSSLAETNRVVSHVEQMLREMPEVESTSRRTGLQLGLAAVTEANSGDILVKLKSKRDRGIDEIMADVRTDIKREEPALDIDLIQVLQDMLASDKAGLRA